MFPLRQQGCFTSVVAAVAPLEQLRKPDGQLALYLQPYILPGPLSKFGEICGPFGGCIPVSAHAPANRYA
jgi:hypothetical protein